MKIWLKIKREFKNIIIKKYDFIFVFWLPVFILFLISIYLNPYVYQNQKNFLINGIISLMILIFSILLNIVLKDLLVPKLFKRNIYIIKNISICSSIIIFTLLSYTILRDNPKIGIVYQVDTDKSAILHSQLKEDEKLSQLKRIIPQNKNVEPEDLDNLRDEHKLDMVILVKPRNSDKRKINFYFALKEKLYPPPLKTRWYFGEPIPKTIFTEITLIQYLRDVCQTLEGKRIERFDDALKILDEAEDYIYLNVPEERQDINLMSINYWRGILDYKVNKNIYTLVKFFEVAIEYLEASEEKLGEKYYFCDLYKRTSLIYFDDILISDYNKNPEDILNNVLKKLNSNEIIIDRNGEQLHYLDAFRKASRYFNRYFMYRDKEACKEVIYNAEEKVKIENIKNLLMKLIIKQFVSLCYRM